MTHVLYTRKTIFFFFDLIISHSLQLLQCSGGAVLIGLSNVSRVFHLCRGKWRICARSRREEIISATNFFFFLCFLFVFFLKIPPSFLPSRPDFASDVPPIPHEEVGVTLFFHERRAKFRERMILTGLEHLSVLFGSSPAHAHISSPFACADLSDTSSDPRTSRLKWKEQQQVLRVPLVFSPLCSSPSSFLFIFIFIF